jgi:lipoprotein-anchoring transpeptidase ErfK/SrfK
MERFELKLLVIGVDPASAYKGLIIMYRVIAMAALLVLGQPVCASELTAGAINDASFTETAGSSAKISPLVIKCEVLLDRAGFSPGQIDGKSGDNFIKAMAAFAAANNLPAGKTLTPEIWAKLQTVSSEPITVSYVVTLMDVTGPYVKKIPGKMEKMKSLKRLGYTSPKESLSERFHMSQDLLASLNRGEKYKHPGDKITVINIGNNSISQQAARIEVNKSRQTVKAFSDDGKLIAFYPATVGSEEKPTPSGTLKVVSVDPNPIYHYNPKYHFKGVTSKKPFEIKPGPNNPVGIMWIDLSGDGYGIHGTPEPSRISKSESHGCVRLTNWDAVRLSKLVKKGVPVEFVNGAQASR